MQRTMVRAAKEARCTLSTAKQRYCLTQTQSCSVLSSSLYT